MIPGCSLRSASHRFDPWAASCLALFSPDSLFGRLPSSLSAYLTPSSPLSPPLAPHLRSLVRKPASENDGALLRAELFFWFPFVQSPPKTLLGVSCLGLISSSLDHDPEPSPTQHTAPTSFFLLAPTLRGVDRDNSRCCLCTFGSWHGDTTSKAAISIEHCLLLLLPQPATVSRPPARFRPNPKRGTHKFAQRKHRNFEHLLEM